MVEKPKVLYLIEEEVYGDEGIFAKTGTYVIGVVDTLEAANDICEGAGYELERGLLINTELERYRFISSVDVLSNH